MGLCLLGSRIREQAIKFRFDCLIALASPYLQFGPIYYRDVATAATDQAGVLQLPDDLRDAFATYAE